MSIDHMAAVFFPDILILRIIGRLTMPIMAFFIAQGYAYTKDIKRYILRLLIASAISIIPFGMLFGWSSSGNVMLTLALGLMVIWCEEHIENNASKIFAIIFLYALSIFGDWPIIGIIMIQGFWRAKKNGTYWNTMLTITFLILFALGSIFSFMTFTNQSIIFHLGQGLASGGGCFLVYPLLKAYNGRQGPKSKWLFYGFYPLHLTIILLIKSYLSF